MALFARRFLQRILDENASFLTSEQRANICRLFNTVREDYLATEWEQVIVNAFSKVGSLWYEPTFGGSQKPDFLFKSDNPPLEFIADVTTASEKGLHRLNPVEALEEQFERHMRKRKLVSGGFDVQVDSHPSSVYRGSHETVRLKLPKQSKFPDKIFNIRFHDFLNTVCARPEQRHEYHAIDEETGVHISYDPRNRGHNSGGHLSFTVANRIDHNPVYNALKAKGDQLKGTGYGGHRGVLLCDGGCQMLRSKWKNWNEFSADDVVRHFLRQFESVSFVATLAVREERQSLQPRPSRHIEPKLYVNPKWTEDRATIVEVVKKVCRLLPQPEHTPENALRRLKFQHGISPRYWKGGLVVGSHVKMSARMLLELLAGRKSVADLEREFGMQPSQNPFKRMLEEGKLISSVSVQRQPDEDDDVVTIEFGKTDPAVTPFSVKR